MGSFRVSWLTGMRWLLGQFGLKMLYSRVVNAFATLKINCCSLESWLYEDIATPSSRFGKKTKAVGFPRAYTSSSRSQETKVDASARSSLPRDVDHSDERSGSIASDVETEWVEQDEPGFYIMIRALTNGSRELRHVKFSRKRFGEMHARVCWEENKARIQEQYDSVLVIQGALQLDLYNWNRMNFRYCDGSPFTGI